MQGTRDRDVADADGADVCRRLARLLGADAVAAVTDGSADVEDVVGGRAEGLIVFPLGSVPDERERAFEPAVRIRALDAIRSAMRATDANLERVLAAAADELGVRELIFGYERGGRIHVAAVPANDRPRAFPRRIRSELEALDRALPPTEATVQKLAVVTGARSPYLAAAFAAEDRLEILLAGSEDLPLESAELAVVGRAIALARDVLEGRERIAGERLSEDRERWAAEIHDGVTQAVTAAFLELHRLAQLDGIDAPTAAAIDETSDAVRTALFDLRGILFDLTCPDPIDAPRDDRARAYVRGLAERWKSDVELTIEGDLDAIDEATFEVGRQVARESIANAAKHADADTVRVSMRATGGTFVVEIVDDGTGFDPEQVRGSPGHLGIRLIRERVAEAGGTFGIEAAPGTGARVHAELPTAPAQT